MSIFDEGPPDELDGVLAETTIPPWSIYVDFNDLYARYGATTTFEILGKLKDLLA